MVDLKRKVQRKLRMEPSIFRRPYLVTWSRDGSTRRYSCFINAIRKTIERAILEGRPRDTFEIAHNDLGMQFAVFKVHTGGKLTVDYTPEIQNLKGLPRF